MEHAIAALVIMSILVPYPIDSTILVSLLCGSMFKGVNWRAHLLSFAMPLCRQCSNAKCRADRHIAGGPCQVSMNNLEFGTSCWSCQHQIPSRQLWMTGVRPNAMAMSFMARCEAFGHPDDEAGHPVKRWRLRSKTPAAPRQQQVPAVPKMIVHRLWLDL